MLKKLPRLVMLAREAPDCRNPCATFSLTDTVVIFHSSFRRPHGKVLQGDTMHTGSSRDYIVASQTRARHVEIARSSQWKRVSDPTRQRAGMPATQVASVRPLLLRAAGRHSRQLCRTNAFGFPGKVPRATSIVGGFRTADLVRAAVSRCG
jgi:hypothetical protein